MKSILTISLMAIACLTAQAQTSKSKAKPSHKTSEVKVLAKFHDVLLTPYSEATIDAKNHQSTIAWPETENNSWHENMGFVKNIPTVTDDIRTLFPQYKGLAEDRPYSPIAWMLTEENDETVLHCYFRMPADVVTNFWLCSDECVILDKETGTIYQSRRTKPDCYGKVFSFNGKEGTTLDFQIFFPKLPETAKDICIYGVPNWLLRGTDVHLESSTYWRDFLEGEGFYDDVPTFHQPHLVSEAKDYDKDNFKSWAVYQDAHLVKPVKADTYAMWCTREATYLAEACELNWMREYFGRGGKAMLVDQSGHQYKCKGVLNYPNDHLFWVEGHTGDFFAIVLVFEPLPPETENVTYVVPEGEPFAMWGAEWNGSVLPFSVRELRDNQKLFEYHPRKIVK